MVTESGQNPWASTKLLQACESSEGHSAATVCGELMTLTDIQVAHDLVHPMLRKWNGVIEACHRWLDGYRDENCSVLKDIAENYAF